MTPDEERACYERAINAVKAVGHSAIAVECVKAIRALPLTTESAPTQSSTAEKELSTAWRENLCGDMNCQEVRLLSALKVIRGGKTHRELADTIASQEGVGQGEIAQGAAPLEPVAYGVQMQDKWWVGLWAWKENAEQVAAKHSGDKVIPLHAIPPGYAVVPVEPTEANVGTYCDGWMKSFQAANLHHSDIECTEEDRVHIFAGLRAMLAAGRVK